MARRRKRQWPRKAWRGLRQLPAWGWVLVGLAALAALDVAWQLARKPTEILGIVAPTARKSPEATWSAYGDTFDAHATALVDPAFLAALAQVESEGNPLARTYWTWRWSWNPLDLYGPASSAVGLMQITDGTYQQARRLCVHDHAVAREGPWHDPDTCWLNGLYFRALPGHAVEMTSAWLTESVERVLREQRLTKATADQKRQLAAVVHLCGRERAVAHARRGFRAAKGERCGAHDLAGYLAKVSRLRQAFLRMPVPR